MKPMNFFIRRNINTCYKFYSCTTKTNVSNHPYYNIHPWKSQNDLSKFLLANVIYNKDGLVVINKPYGISNHPENKIYLEKTLNKIVKPVSYTISNSLDYLSKELNYSNLKIIKSPEKYMSGLTLLSDNELITKKILKKFRNHSNLPITYWIVTTKLPKEISGRKHLALGLKKSCVDPKLTSPTLLTEWSKNAVKRNEALPFYVEFKLISNSTNNLASLIEVSTMKRKWHSIRLFAANILHSPILGDNIYGYLIQKVMDSYINVGPFSHLRNQLPVLNKDLLKVLNLNKNDRNIIPVHIHLKKIQLQQYTGKTDLILEAPLMPEFQWTCDRLNFKYLIPNPNNEMQNSEQNHHNYIEEIKCKMQI